MKRVLYMSPHLDDAAFSCGGRIERDLRAGHRVLVVNVFTSDPPEKLSILAKQYHDEWSNGAQSYAVRRAEDKEAMAALECEYRNLGLADAVYRTGADGEAYEDDKQLFGRVSASWDTAVQAELRSAIAEILMLETWDEIYLPLGLGGNIDHYQVRVAALDALKSTASIAVYFYEDIPYAIGQYPWPGYDNAEQAIDRLGVAVKPEVAEVPFGRKAKAIRAYGSQLAGLFGSADGAVGTVETYGMDLGAGTYSERAYKKQ